MPSALFEIYQKNFDKTLKRLSGMIELYQNQTKEAQSVTLKEIELNISEMERCISQMELEMTLEKISDNKKKLTKIIDNNKNIVKQYKREIQDLKYKSQSILNKKNLAYIPANKKNKTTQLNFLKENNENNDINNIFNNNTNLIVNEDEDTALFIDKNINKKKVFDKYNINDETNDEMSLKTDEGIKRINEHNNKNNININIDINNEMITKVKNNNNGINLSSKKNINDEKDKDSANNKYKIYKDSVLKKIFGIIFNIIKILVVFSKNIIYKGYKNLKHYLHHRYGQANSRIIMMVIFILGFIFIYSIILILWNSYKTKMPTDNSAFNINGKNNSLILDSKNDVINNTIIENNKIAENNTLLNNTSINNISSNISNNNNN